MVPILSFLIPSGSKKKETRCVCLSEAKPSHSHKMWTEISSSVPLFLACVNDIWRKTESNIWVFTNDCIIYRKIMDSNDIDKLQTDLNGLGESVEENAMKINPGISKAVNFTKARVKERIRYYFGDQLILEASSFKYLGIIICNDLNWADHVNYTLQKTSKAHHFIICILKKGNSTKHLAYTALVRPVLGYGVMCWDPYREGQVSTLNRLQKRATKFSSNMSRVGNLWHCVY